MERYTDLPAPGLATMSPCFASSGVKPVHLVPVKVPILCAAAIFPPVENPAKELNGKEAATRDPTGCVVLVTKI